MTSPHNFPSSPNARTDLYIGHSIDTHQLHNCDPDSTRVTEKLAFEENLAGSTESGRTGYERADASIVHVPVVQPTHSQSGPPSIGSKRSLQYTVAPDRPAGLFPYPPGNFEGHPQPDGTITWSVAPRLYIDQQADPFIGRGSHPQFIRSRNNVHESDMEVDRPYTPMGGQHYHDGAPGRSEFPPHPSSQHYSNHSAPLTYPSRSHIPPTLNDQQGPVYSPVDVCPSPSGTPTFLFLSSSPPELVSGSNSSNSDELVSNHEQQLSEHSTPLQSSNDTIELDVPRLFIPSVENETRSEEWHQMDRHLRKIFGLEEGRRVDLWSVADPVVPNGKPRDPLHRLAELAIHGSARGMLTLNEIRDALRDRFEYFKIQDQLYAKEAKKRVEMNGELREAQKRGEKVGETAVKPHKSWQDSLRHALSLHKIFIQKDRPITEPGKGKYWALDITGIEGYKRERKRRKKNVAPFTSLHRQSPVASRSGSGSLSANTEGPAAVDMNVDGSSDEEEDETDNASDRSGSRSDCTPNQTMPIRAKRLVGQSRRKSPYGVPTQRSSSPYSGIMGSRLSLWSMTAARMDAPKFGQSSFPNVGMGFGGPGRGQWTGFPGQMASNASASGSGSQVDGMPISSPENQRLDNQHSV